MTDLLADQVVRPRVRVKDGHRRKWHAWDFVEQFHVFHSRRRPAFIFTRNVLSRYDFKTVREVRRTPNRHLMRLPYCGMVTVAGIRHAVPFCLYPGEDEHEPWESRERAWNEWSAKTLKQRGITLDDTAYYAGDLHQEFYVWWNKYGTAPP